MLNSSTPSASHPLLRLGFYAVALGLAMVHVFITFRGLSSADGMEQAQLARELARGNGFQTKVIRPYAWARLVSAAKETSPLAMPDITQPPLQPLLWSPVFRLLSRHFPYEPAKNGAVYLLDRAVACMGVTGLLLTLLWTHGAARRLFDEKIAGVVVLALMLCEPLWKLSVSGSPVALLLPLFALSFRVYVSAQKRAEDGLGIWLQMAALGLLSALMLLTHWMALWLVAGLVLAVAQSFPGRRSGAVLVALLPMLALGGWGAWLMQQCGDPLGGAKTLFQAHLMTLEPALLQREFSVTTQPVFVDDLLRKVAVNWRSQLSEGFAHLGYLVPSALFFVGLFHRFRRQEVARANFGLGIIFASVALGMGFLGLEDKVQDDDALYIVLAPALATFGAAMLAVLWSRLQVRGSYLWQTFGFGALAVALSALPMAATFPAEVKLGLTLRSRIYPHWPPYVPQNIAVVRNLIDKNEMLFSDAPWFVAWYADVPTAWVPVKRADFAAMQERAKAHDVGVAGFIITPVSARVAYLHEAFTGPYREWPDLVFRGPMLAFDKEFQPHPDFAYKVALPLMAITIGPKENLSLQMTFYSDKMRSVKDRRPK